MRSSWIAGLALAAATCGSAPAGGLQVPILVQEPLPAGTAGRPRVAEPVSVGIPLDVEDGVTETSQLGLRGATAAQFRVLERDRETGRVRWVVVHFLADTPGGNYALVDGRGDFGGPDLAADRGPSIVVSTGVARVEIRKSGFNLFDRVLRGHGQVLDP